MNNIKKRYDVLRREPKERTGRGLPVLLCWEEEEDGRGGSGDFSFTKGKKCGMERIKIMFQGERRCL
ncbi:MAG: hypothetical protein V8R11_05465 [Alphaproteobacteria bacterium]